MPIPKTLRIGFGTFKVRSDRDATQLLIEQSRAGSASGDWLSINVRNDLPPETTAETLLHEVLHMALYAAGTELDTDEEEKVVRPLSMMLFRVLRDNPQLVEFLTEKK